jgi:hypothetical protein
MRERNKGRRGEREGGGREKREMGGGNVKLTTKML